MTTLVELEILSSFAKVMKELSSFTITSMSSKLSGKAVEGSAELMANGTDKYTLKYQTLPGGHILYNIQPVAKDGTAFKLIL